MNLKKVHVANFRCIRDSGIIDIEDFKTVLIGKNESGKTSFLKALEHFNMDSDFDTDDLCDFGKKEKDCTCVITVWFQLTEKEKDLRSYLGETVRITKLLTPIIKENVPKSGEPNQSAITTNLADYHWKTKFGYRYFESFDDIIAKLKHIRNFYRFEDRTGRTVESILLEKALSIVSNLVEALNIDICKDKERGRVINWLETNGGVQYGFIQTQSGEDVYADPSDIMEHDIFAQRTLEKNEEVIFDIAETDYIPRKPPYRLRTKLKAKNIFRKEYFFNKIDRNVIEGLKLSISSYQNNPNNIFSKLRNDLYLYCLSEIKDSFPNLISHVEYTIQEIAKLEVIPYLFLHSVPKFIYISESDELEDSVDTRRFLSDPLSHRPIFNLFKLAEMEVSTLEKDTTPKSRASISDKLSETFTNLIKPYWTQSGDLRTRIQVEENRIDFFISDELGNLIPPSKRSNGFQWYLSFIINLELQSKSDLAGNIILLDDPGLNLHPIAQTDMLKFLDSLSTKPCQIVMATHSPFLIDPARLSIIRTFIRERNEEVGTGFRLTEIKKMPYDRDLDAFKPVRAAIGMTLAQTLLVSSYNLIVSGPTDMVILSVNKCLNLLDTRITVYPLSGDSKIPYFVHIFEKSGSTFLVLLDADQSGRNTREQLLNENRIEEERILLLDQIIDVGREIEIEDLFSDEFYNEMVNSVYEAESGQNISLGDLDKEKKQTERYKKWFENNCGKIRFEKRKVAEAIEKFVWSHHLNPEKLGRETLYNFTNLFKLINFKLKL